MRFIEKLNEFVLVLGIPGLFLLALLDSAALPIAGGPEAVVVILAWQRPGHVWLIVAAAVVGSTLGSLLLYRIGRAGGELALTRLSKARRSWIREKLERHSFWTILFAELVPPPIPIKPVIVAAGVFHMPLDQLSIGILVGRSIRYMAAAYLGAHLGKQAASVMTAQFPFILLSIGVLILLLLAVRRLLRKFA